MGLFDIFKKKEKTITCVKCKKEKKESEGFHIYDGKAFCCKECCGDPSRGEHNQQKDKVCEFC